MILASSRKQFVGSAVVTTRPGANKTLALKDRGALWEPQATHTHVTDKAGLKTHQCRLSRTIKDANRPADRDPYGSHRELQQMLHVLG
ncbi:hypothetical protein J7T55_001489 [Diaporthe amygdali]|uniref:uncharacterized protein n=1 Tax=Phomopsis amygdali TaxID=1214568 RepID=UPI0022FE6F08|nr:uncharacterized protein J7T55_001489 [Diaporthe amygdali]KAJ0115080.1 hypothetical protein J7T55_001489 [Diaporthe amygdali]